MATPEKKSKRKYSILVTGTARKQLQANHRPLWFPSKNDNATYIESLKLLIEPITKGLSKYYENVSIKVVDNENDNDNMPDFSDPHSINWGSFKLAAKGLSGNTRLADCGGVPYMNDPKYHHITYQLTDIVKVCGLEKALVIGAGAASPKVVGKNAELMPNTMVPGPRHTMFARMDSPRKLKNNDSNDNSVDSSTDNNNNNDNSNNSNNNNSNDNESKVDDSEEEVPYVGIYPSEETGCLANLFLSDGESGPLLYLKVGQRKDDKGLNLAQCIREALNDYRKEQNVKEQIGMGGIIKVNKGKIRSHIMPDFCNFVLEKKEQVENWLKFFEVGPDLVMFTTLLTGDPTENDSMHLRCEHTHFHSTHSHSKQRHEGGHYHYDTVKDVEYEAYLNIAQYIYRVEDAQYNIDNESKL